MRIIMNSFIVIFLVLNILPNGTLHAKTSDELSIIVEVEDNAYEKQRYIEKNYPFVKILARYDVLFQGLALQAKERHLQEIANLSFVKAVHRVHIYESDEKLSLSKSMDLKQLTNEQTNLPHLFNDTFYTGKGVKVGVIDTGIDYNHPYLKKNYKGGYDLVDLDDDPMETLPEEGIPTVHGTHVAGIIAAEGEFTGVAPDAEVYGYRALGPGGRGTSVQVIAAMEQAIKDEMDIINLSLGNSINGPDYPTSIAVNQATKLGTIVVIANGNDGPEDWTVGSPATASGAISVGAMTPQQNIYVLTDTFSKIEIPLIALPGSSPWNLEQTIEIVEANDLEQHVHGKVLFFRTYDESFYDAIFAVEKAGALGVFVQLEDDEIPMLLSSDEEISIPIIPLSKEQGQWLANQLNGKSYLARPTIKSLGDTIASFSSRGPVTGDWVIKPDIVAPGTHILSTVPGGLQEFQGTSMAAPHVTGGIALIKEAQPTWTKGQIVHAIKTTAHPLYDESGKIFPPSLQGAGLLKINDAIITETIIDGSNLSFGKISSRQQRVKKFLTIENMTNSEQTYSFSIPKQGAGYNWTLPSTFTLEPYEKRDIPIELLIQPLTLATGVHQGFLTIQSKDKSYKIPYLFVYEAADYPILMGFNVGLKPFTQTNYTYQFYLAEDITSMHVDLFQARTLQFEQRLLSLQYLTAGLNQGELNKENIPSTGEYIAQITVEQKDGTKVTYAQELWIE